MNTQTIERHFSKIGARAKFHDGLQTRRRMGVSIDIGRDRDGEFFDIVCDQTLAEDLSVVDVQPQLRHLLLMSRQGTDKHKFLCGHDERHWFVAAVPERAAASTVRTAFEALKPQAIQAELIRRNVKPKRRNRRRNDAFLRQGEWFFIPMPAARAFPKLLILKNEPLSRGGKPHMCEELVRFGGETVYVSVQHPNGLTEREYRKVLSQQPKMRGLHWTTQRRNPGVFVRGKIRHPDHKTIHLADWHRVLMNTETESLAMRHVAFID